MIFMRENSISFTVAKLQTCEEYFKTVILLLVLVMQILRVKNWFIKWNYDKAAARQTFKKIYIHAWLDHLLQNALKMEETSEEKSF